MGLLSRIRGKKKGQSSSKARTASKASATPKPEATPERAPSPELREPSHDQVRKQEKEAWKPVHHPPIYVTEPPSAREAAFGGPPRFDWIDIETNAAIKIQSIWRRIQVMTALEQEGKSTSAIRNRARRRKAAERNARSKTAQSGDAPSLFQCCGVGLAFGDATEEDDEAYREFQKKQYEQRQLQQAAHEEALRSKYLRSKGITQPNVVEKLEVTEDEEN